MKIQESVCIGIIFDYNIHLYKL